MTVPEAVLTGDATASEFNYEAILSSNLVLTTDRIFSFDHSPGVAMYLILKPVRVVLKAFVADATPRELALGFAFGVLIGFVPKGNLIAISLSIIMAASRANLGIAAATILGCSLLSPFLDPAFDAVGGWLLAHPDLQNVWTQLYNQPVLPWTDFNNTVVLGSFVIGLAALYPSYRVSKPIFEKYTQRVAVWARRYWLIRALLGLELADRLTISR